MQNLGKASLFSRNQVICLKIENFEEFQLPSSCRNFFTFLQKFCPFRNYQCLQKGFFLFCLVLELFGKIEKDLVSNTLTETRVFTFFLIAQDQKQN